MHISEILGYYFRYNILMKMLKTLLTLSILFSSLTFLRAELIFNSVKNSGESFLTVSSKNCSDFDNFLRDLTKWKLPEGKACTPLLEKSPDLCTARLLHCVPQKIVDVYGVKFAQNWTDIDGPNCFGTALYTAGLTPALTFTTGKNIVELMQNPLCKKIEDNAPPKAGDIGLVYKEDSLLHGFTYLSDDYIWHKGNGDSSTVPKIETMKSMRENLDVVSSECRVCFDKKTDGNKEGCSFCLAPLKISYFRCLSAEETYKKMRKDIRDSDLENQLNQLDQVTCQLSDFLYSKGTLSKSNADTVFDSLRAIARYYHDEKKKKPINVPPSSERDWMLTMMALRIQSLKVQNENSYSMLEIEAPFRIPNDIKQLLDLND